MRAVALLTYIPFWMSTKNKLEQLLVIIFIKTYL